MAAAVVGVPVVVLVLLVLLLQIDALSTAAGRWALERANPWRDGSLEVERATLSGLSRLAVVGLRVHSPEGAPLVEVDTLRAEIRILPLIGGALELPSLRVAGVRVWMRQRPDSAWDLLAPFEATEDTVEATGKSGFSVRMGPAALERASLEADFLAASDSTLRVQDLTLRLDTLTWPRPTRVTVDTLDARLFPPTRPASPARLSGALRLASGALATPGIRLVSDSSDVRAVGTLLLPDSTHAAVRDIDFTLAASPLDFRDVGALLPGFDVAGSLQLDARVSGSTDLLEVRVDGRSFDGGTLHLEGSLTPRARDSLRYALSGRVRDLDPSLWSAGDTSTAAISGIDADVEIALGGPALDSLDGTVSLDVGGARVAGGTLRPTHVQATFTGGAAEFDASGGADPWVDVTAHGTARPFDSLPTFDLRGTLRQRDPLHAGGTRIASMVATVRAAGHGFAPALTRGEATVGLAGSIGDLRIEDGSLTARWDSANADARAHLPIEGGDVRAHALADWSGPALRLNLRSFSADRLDLAGLLGDTIAGSLSLTGSGSAVVGDPGRTVVEADVAIERARWRELTVDTGRVRVALRDSALTARARAVAPAGALELLAHARPFAGTPRWRVDTLRVRDLDLAEVRQGLPTTRVDALARGEGRGFAPADAEGDLSLALGRSRLVEAMVDTATVRIALREGRVAVEGDARALGGALELAAEGRPFDPTPTFRLTRALFDTLRVDSTLAVPVRAVLSGSLEGEATLPPDGFPTVRTRLRIDGGRLNAQPIDSALVEAHSEGRRAGLDATLAAGGGHADVHGTATLARDTTGLRIRDARADGTIQIPDLGGLMGRDSADAALDARFALSGDGAELRSMRWEATLEATGRYDAARLDSLALRASLTSGVLLLDTLTLTSNFARGGGGGVVALYDDAQVPDSVTRRGLDLRLTTDSIAVLADLLGVHPLSMRGGSLQAHAEHGDGGVRVTGEAGAGGLIGPSVAADTLHAEFTALLHDARLARADVEVRGDAVSLPSTVLEEVGGTMSHDSTGTEFAVRARRDDAHDVRMAGMAHMAARTLRLDSLNVDLPDRSWRLDRPAMLGWGDRIDPGGLTLAADDSRIAFEGTLDRTGTQDLTIRLDSVPVKGFAEMAGLQGLTGVFDGALEVTGPAARLGLRGNLDANIGEATAHIAVRPAEGDALGVEIRMTDTDDEPLTAQGTIPFRLSLTGEGSGAPADQTMGLDIRARAFSVDWIAPFLRPLGVQTFDAELTADARLEGTMADPSLTGSASLARGRLEIPEQGVSYTDVHGDLEFAGDRIHVPSLTATAEGTAEIQGDVVLAPLDRPSFDLQAHFHRFEAVDNAWTHLRVNADLTVSGDVVEPRVTGSAQVENTDIYADQVGEGQSVRPVELTQEDYRMLASYFGYRPSESNAVQRDPMLGWGIDMSLDIGNDVWVRRRTQPEMRVQVDGSLDVRKESGDSLQLFGTVEAVTGRSYFEQFGRRFTIADGTVTFNGSPTDWRIDAGARYDVPSSRDPNRSEATITLDVSGRADDLSLTLGSEPSMENADILSYLATGRPAASAAEFGNAGSSSGSGGVLGAGEEFALGRVAGVLEETAEEAVGLDVVEIRQNGLKGATLVAGRYVNPRLFVGFQQPLTLSARSEETASDPSSLGTKVEIEYTWYRWLLVHVQGGQSTLRLFFRTKYAY